jgi:hypothetical protein
MLVLVLGYLEERELETFRSVSFFFLTTIFQSIRERAKRKLKENFDGRE